MLFLEKLMRAGPHKLDMYEGTSLESNNKKLISN